MTFILNWQFSRELPDPVQAGASAFNGSHALGDGQIQLKVVGPVSLRDAYLLILISAWSISLDSTFKTSHIWPWIRNQPVLGVLNRAKNKEQKKSSLVLSDNSVHFYQVLISL